MLQIQLDDLFQLGNKLSQYNFCIIHANPDDYAIVNYITTYIKEQINQSSTCNNYSFDADRYFQLESISNILQNQSLFADNNYIEIRYKTKPTQEQQTKLINLAPHLQNNNFLTITTDKLTKKDLDAKWTRHQSGNEKQFLVIGITNTDYRNVVQHMFHIANLNITQSALDMLIQLNLANPSQLIQEANRLILYTSATINDDRQGTSQHALTIDIECIKNLIFDNSKFNIYQMSSAYLNGNLKTAISILDNIYQNTEDAILIAWIIAEDLRRLIKIKNKLKQKYDINQAMSELKILRSTWHNFIHAEKRLSYKILLTLIDQLAELDMAIKGIIPNKNIKQSIQQIISQISTNINTLKV